MDDGDPTVPPQFSCEKCGGICTLSIIWGSTVMNTKFQISKNNKKDRGTASVFLRFDFRRVQNRSRTGYFILMTPKKKARMTVKARIRELIQNGGAKPAKDIVKHVNATLAGWVNYFRVGNSSHAFSEVRDYTEMKIRTLLTRRKRRQKRSIGWRRWSNEYLYNVLGLNWDWKVHPLKNVEAFR